MSLYFKRYWNETTGDPITDKWGYSTFYFEANSDGIVMRQIQVFDNGMILKYGPNYQEDEFGVLTDQSLDLVEFDSFKIDQSEFDRIWSAKAV